MKKTLFGRPRQQVFVLVGWLFADLFLATTVIFFVQSASYVKAIPYVAPTPTPRPCLQLHPTDIYLTVDAVGLLNNDPGAISDIQTQVRAHTELNGQRAGLVIGFGGTPSVGEGGTATAVTNQVYTALQEMGQQGYVFTGTVYHYPLLSIGDSFDYVHLEVYLFTATSSTQCG